jgi:hypothetical protein
MTKITSKWNTIAVVGFRNCVNAQNSNPSAHGAVCLLQARRNAHGEIVGREVNSNGRHAETGKPFPLPADRLAQWQRIG